MRGARLATAFLFLIVLTGLGQSVHAQQQPPARPVDPVGDFDFTTTVNGQTVTGVITVVKQNDALNGRITSDMGEATITSVKVEARKVTLLIQTPDGAEVTFALAFEDDNKFAGTWYLGGDSGAISGKRRTQ